MPTFEEVRFYLGGIRLLIVNDPAGFQRLDLSDRGMMRSFWAIVWCLPAIFVSWLWRRAVFLGAMPEGTEAGAAFFFRLAMVEALSWLFPLVLIGGLLLALGQPRLFPAIVTVNNWLSVPFAYAYAALVLLLLLLPGALGLISLLWLALVGTLVAILFRVMHLLCGGQALMSGTLTMLLLVPPLILADWLQRFLGI